MKLKNDHRGFAGLSANASALLASLCACASLLGQEALPSVPLETEPQRQVRTEAEGPAQVYVVPVHGPISSAQLYILRRGLKAAVEKDIDAV